MAPASRNTYVGIARALKSRIAADPTLRELPSAAELVLEYGVSRGTVLRAFRLLERDVAVQRRPGERWLILRGGETAVAEPLVDRVAALIRDKGLQPGDPFVSATELAVRFGVSRPTVTRVLDKLAARGVLASGRQGVTRTVVKMPDSAARTGGNMATSEPSSAAMTRVRHSEPDCPECVALEAKFAAPETVSPASCLAVLAAHHLDTHDAKPQPRVGCVECAKYSASPQGVHEQVWRHWALIHFMTCALAPAWVDAKNAGK